MFKLFTVSGVILVLTLVVLAFAVKGTRVAAQNSKMAAFRISTANPARDETVTFDATNPGALTGNIISYSWDFGDGTTAIGVTTTHAFTAIGDFKVVLTITDASGAAAQSTQFVAVGRPEGWTIATHSKRAAANYELLFSEAKVNRIEIVISAADYRTMEENIFTMNMGEEPVYVPATVRCNGYIWRHVGIRYKGNSSLFTMIDGTFTKHKYPFRLDFDRYEDTYPETKDQRCYGFKNLLFNNNWFDATYIRDVVCSDLFRAAGIPTARGAFCRVYIDSGDGLVYWGLYSMFEDTSDQMRKTQFTNPDGNMYKGQAAGADWTAFNQNGFAKKTNEAADDWSDLRAVIAALNAPRGDADVWRAGLEAVFNVRLYLRWLAINTAVVNPDNYGRVTTNYYLYQDLADNGRLVFVPWDFGLSLSTTNILMFDVLSLSLSEVSDKWPLIRYLMDDPVYQSIYRTEMRTAMDGCFNEAAITTKIRRLHELIRPYVVGAEGESSRYTYLTNGATEFDRALTDLVNHVLARQVLVRNFLGE